MAMATPEEQLGKILALLGENSKGIDDLKSSMKEMKTLKTELMVWKPQVDNRVHELEYAVMDLGERIDRALSSLPHAQPIDPSPEEQSGEVTIAEPSLTAAIQEDHFISPGSKGPSSAHLELHPHRAAPGSLDHGKGHHHRGADFGAVYTIAPETAPVTGANFPHKHASATVHAAGYGHRDRSYYPYPPYPPITPFPELEFH
jgi:hypothetical protein